MRFQTPLIPARLIRRYNRFLADVALEYDGEEVVAHCPNPGSMMGLKEPGTRIWLEPNDDPTKKLKFGWRLVELPNKNLACIDTAVPNRVVKEALGSQTIEDFAGYSNVRPEVKYSKNSRIDFLLSEDGHADIYIEVKNVHLMREAGLAEFPDCITARGAKHLHDLSAMVSEGHRAVMLYLVQRTDCSEFALARDLDRAYGQAFDMAMSSGVEVMCFSTQISTQGVKLASKLPVLELK
ncbi:MAG: DNA/RNA nuclease SfsA [Pseudomonadota bacterium]